MVAAFLVRAVDDPADDEARANMLLAASLCGRRLRQRRRASAARHVVSGVGHGARPTSAPGYPADHPLVPHGMSVILNAPAVFRFTAPASPERHLQAAEALGVDVSRARPDDAGRILADRITWFMQRLNMPNGLQRRRLHARPTSPRWSKGTLPQHRVTKLSPRPAGADELSAIVRRRDGRVVNTART